MKLIKGEQNHPPQ